MFRPPWASLSTKIIASVVITVLLIGGGSFWILQDFYNRQMIESLAESTTVHGELIEQSLRHAMHTRSLDFLAQMVRRLASQKGVENVLILNKKGEIRFSSDARDRGRVLAKSDPTCSICHERGPLARGRTVTFERSDGTRVFRNVNPILNDESCTSCHSPNDRINGILIVDYSMAGIEASLGGATRKMWLSAVALAVAITAVIMFFMRKLVLRRLAGLVQVIDSIEAGEMDRPVDIRGDDEIGKLSSHLKRMSTSLRRTLDHLRHRESFLDAVINSAEDGIVVVDDRMQVVTANRAFEELLGVRAGTLAQTLCDCSKLGEECSQQECPALRTLRTGQSSRRLRVITRRDGSRRHFEISDSRLRNFDDRPQVLEVWRDITERREFEARLEHSERLASLGLLASGISHEINNPLASIMTCLDGLGRRLRAGNGTNGPIPEELPEYLDLIRGEVDRCRALTQRLQLLGRKPRHEPQPVNLSTVVRDILALVRYEAKKHRVRIVEELATDVEAIIADESQIRQVVLNIVLNAIQAIGDRGEVRVRTRSNGQGGVEVEVTDNGRGIEPQHLPKIFEPFFSARADGRGTGLGLFISKIVVDQLDGRIDVRSMPGQGTTFTISLPSATASSTEVSS